MTAEAFADLVQARRTGRGKWQARCPAHADRSPSLSIREGPGGSILLHCFAGCTVPAILGALRLANRDLYPGPPPSPEQVAALMATQHSRQTAEKAVRKARLDALNRERKLEALVNILGAKLARSPECALEDDVLTQLFHVGCARLHEAEQTVTSFYGVHQLDAQDKDDFHGIIPLA